MTRYDDLFLGCERTLFSALFLRSSMNFIYGFLQKAVSFLKEYLSGFFFIPDNNNYHSI